jgi:non-canonical (house-cleaning) NTP pyrophosphatase
MIHDIGAIVARNSDGSYRIASSAGIRFPQQFYHEANRRGFAKHTVGEVLAEDEALMRMGVDKDPHKYYTGGVYGREDFLTLPTSLVLMNDTETQGPKIESKLRERIQNSGLRLPENMKILSTSTQDLKNDAISNVLNMLNAASVTVESHDGTLSTDSRQIMSLTDGFQAAYDRIETIHRDDTVPRKPGDVSVSIQSCLIPVILGAELRYLDVATVLAERIDEDGVQQYYSSVSAGTEFPADSVRLAVQEGVTAGQKIAEAHKLDNTDPQKGLYGVSRQVLLEEAIFATFAQMQSGLEVQ